MITSSSCIEHEHNYLWIYSPQILNVFYTYKLWFFRFQVDLTCFLDENDDDILDNDNYFVDDEDEEMDVNDDELASDDDLLEEVLARERREAGSEDENVSQRRLERMEKRRLAKLAKKAANKAARQERLENNPERQARLAAKQARLDAHKAKKLQRQEMRRFKMAEKIARKEGKRAERMENKVILYIAYSFKTISYLALLYLCMPCCPVLQLQWTCKYQVYIYTIVHAPSARGSRFDSVNMFRPQFLIPENFTACSLYYIYIYIYTSI